MIGFVVIGALVAAAFVIVLITAINEEKRIYTDGIEVDSVVCRVESSLNRDCDTRYSCYVRYKGDDGMEHEGRLNVRSDLPIGRRVRVKYLSGKYDRVAFVSQEIE